MSDTPTGAARPSISDADLHAAVHDAAMVLHTMDRALRQIEQHAASLGESVRRWRDRHGTAFAHVIDELANAAAEQQSATPVLTIDLRAFAVDPTIVSRAIEDELRDMMRGPVRPSGCGEDPSDFTTREPVTSGVMGRVSFPVVSFPGALPNGDIADILAAIDERGDTGLPCPETDHSGGCRWCYGSGLLALGVFTRWIAEGGDVNQARAALGLRALSVQA